MPRDGDGAAAGDVAEGTKSARTRERILDAAARVLNRRGYAGTRLSEIADLAELQAPAIYYYFPSRDDLVEEVVLVGLRRVIKHVTERLQALPRDVSAIDRICAAVAAHLEVVLEESEYATAAIRNGGQLPPAIRENQLRLRRQYGALWRTLIDDGVLRSEIRPELNPRAARMLVIGALNWTPEWWNPERGALADMIRNAQLFVRRGLAAD